MSRYEFVGSALGRIEDNAGQFVMVEPGQTRWPEFIEAMAGAKYQSPALPDPLIAERAAMVASRFQTRAALYVAGLLPMVEDSIARADPLTQMAWAEAVIFKRASPTIAKLAEGLGLDEATIDELFRSAMAIEV